MLKPKASVGGHLHMVLALSIPLISLPDFKRTIFTISNIKISYAQHTFFLSIILLRVWDFHSSVDFIFDA
jgi:hypothetical protein